MGKIALEGLEFFAYHGFHQEERKTGNRYGVDIIVKTDFNEASSSDELTKTVDYVKLYEVICTEMQQPSRLLEHVAQRIVDGIFAAFTQVTAIEVTVSKYNPPIGGICKRAYVEVTKERSL